MDNLNEREKQIIERREYKRRLAEDPSFVPFVGEFWSHDDRYRNDGLKPTSDDKDTSPSTTTTTTTTPRFVSSKPPTAPQQKRRYPNRGVHRRVPEEVLNQRWGHDGYEELMRMEELEEREGRKFSTLDEYYRSKRHGGNKQQYRNRRVKADIPKDAGASQQWQQTESIVESFDQQWPTLETTDKKDDAGKKKEEQQWDTASTTKKDEGLDTAATKEEDGWGSIAATKKDEGWGDIQQPQTTGWDTTDAAEEWKQQPDTKRHNNKDQQSRSKQPMSRANHDTKKRPSASRKSAVSNEKEEEEVEWKSLASWDTGKADNDVNWKSDTSPDNKIKSTKTNGDDSWNASLPWEESTAQTTDDGWGNVDNQVTNDDDWKKSADWAQSTGGWSSSPATATTNGWDDVSSSNKTGGWGSTTSGSWRATEDKKQEQPASREQRRGRGYLSQKKPLGSTTKSKPMSKHAKPFSPSQPINTTPTLPTTTSSKPASASDNTSSLYAFATEPWQSSGSPRDDARGHERFIEDQEDQESDVEIILEADTSPSASRSEVDTATPPQQRDLEGNWRRRDQQQEPVGDKNGGGKDDTMTAQAQAQAQAMQQGIPYFYPPAMGGYMHMPPYPIPMPMTSAPGGAAVPPSAMLPVVTTTAPAASATTMTSTPPNGTNTESPDSGSYVPSSYEANGMVYYSVNPSAMYPYFYYPAPMPMHMMAASAPPHPPPPPPPTGTESPHQQGTDNSVEDGWGPEPDQHAQDSGWEADKNAQGTFNAPFHYYPSYS